MYFSFIILHFAAHICDQMGVQRLQIETSNLDKIYILLSICIHDGFIPILKSTHEVSWPINTRGGYYQCCYTSKLQKYSANKSLKKYQFHPEWKFL